MTTLLFSVISLPSYFLSSALILLEQLQSQNILEFSEEAAEQARQFHSAGYFLLIYRPEALPQLLIIQIVGAEHSLVGVIADEKALRVCRNQLAGASIIQNNLR